MGKVGVNCAFRRAEVDRPDAIKRRRWIEGALCKGGERDEPGDVLYRVSSLSLVLRATSLVVFTWLPGR